MKYCSKALKGQCERNWSNGSDEFCGRCGAEIVELRCKECGYEYLSMNDDFCPKCGTRVNKDEQDAPEIKEPAGDLS